MSPYGDYKNEMPNEDPAHYDMEPRNMMPNEDAGDSYAGLYATQGPDEDSAPLYHQSAPEYIPYDKRDAGEWVDWPKTPNSSSGQDPTASSSGASSELPPPETSSRSYRHQRNYIQYEPKQLEFFKKWSAAEWEPWLLSMACEGPKNYADKNTKAQWQNWYLQCRVYCRKCDPKHLPSENLDSANVDGETKKRRM
jgi:hypothetical protein